MELKSRHLVTKSQSQVKSDYWHNLEDAYNDLEPEQRILSVLEFQILKKSSEIYSAKDFEYFVPADALRGNNRYPDINLLESIAKKLIEASPFHTSAFKKEFSI